MYAVIMAGGVGTRFWPRSRLKRPKQLLSIFEQNTLIQSTANRLKNLVDDKDIFVVTTKPQTEELKEQLPFIDSKNIIVEPKGKNTAPCIGLAAIMLKQLDPDAVMAILPADHKIEKASKFREVLAAAEQFALKKDCLVTIGIHPTYPSTGYGYIQYNGKEDEINNIPVYSVKTSTTYRFTVSKLSLKNLILKLLKDLFKAEIFCGIAECSFGK
ncbi:hypothetical protein B6I21_04275 [candidate division KSB1 bacterium 4572_119]|nr:MAG: hypothetical protein B6I21_04275 [candidate division KSB1 bacterium 4572_119]